MKIEKSLCTSQGFSALMIVRFGQVEIAVIPYRKNGNLRNKTSMTNYNLKNLQINTRANWHLEEEEDVINIYDQENGVGVIQISIFEIPATSKADLKTELFEFIGNFLDLDIRDKITTTTTVENGYAYTELFVNGRYWIYIILRNKNTVLFMTYNCEKEDKGIEDEVVWEVIRSINLK